MLYLRFAGLILLISGISLGIVFLHTPGRDRTIEERLAELPDFDHLQTARKLFVQKRYGEAMIWCDDVISSDLPGRDGAVILRKLCEKQRQSFSRRIRDTLFSFISGNPGSSPEETGAAVLSDMLMYGDIRDLAVQLFYLTTGNDHDWFILALSSAGLATEMVDAADWLPAVLKVLRKSAAISDPLAAGIIRQLTRSAGKLHFTPEAKKTMEHLSGMFRKSGFIRSRNMLVYIHRTDDLKILADFSARNPASTHLLVSVAKFRTPELLKKLAKENASPAFIKKLISKGPNGMTLVLRGGKTVYKGNADRFLQASAGKMLEKYGRKAYFLPLLLIAAGVFFNFDILLNFISRRIRKFRNPERK